MTTTTNNGSPTRSRKQLSDQIDRLDSILDGLADALNESVAQAVKEATGTAVQQAVQGVFTELLSNPELLTRMQPAPPTAAPVSPPSRPTLRDRLAALRKGFVAGGQMVRERAAACWRGTRQAAGKVWSRCLLLGQIKNQVLTALAVGAAAALLTWWAGPWLSTVISGIAGFVTTLAAQLGEWVRGLFSGIPCPTG